MNFPILQTMNLVVNKKALFDFEVIEAIEAGIVLQGTEVRSIRKNQSNLKGSWVKVMNNELVLHNFHISPYSFAQENHPPIQPRKLLLHKKEIERIIQKQKEKGYTMIVTRLYTKGAKIKCELAIVKGKKEYQKKDLIKKRDLDRTTRKELKQY